MGIRIEGNLFYIQSKEMSMIIENKEGGFASSSYWRQNRQIPRLKRYFGEGPRFFRKSNSR